MKNSLEDKLTPTQFAEAIRSARYFPRIARGHGTQHGYPMCNVVNCHPTEPKHRQLTVDAAAEFILRRDRGL